MRLFPSLAPLVPLALFGAALLPGVASAAPRLDVYTLTVGGNSQFGANGNPFGCSTFAPDGAAAMFSRTFELALPTDGAICGVGGVVRSASAAGGTVQVAAPLAVAWGGSADPRTFSGNAQARAGYGNLGVRAVGSYTGASDNGTVAGAQAGARQVDALTFNGGSGNGIYRQTFTVDGSIFNVGRAESEIEFGYSVGTDPTRMAFRITLQQGGIVALYANGAFQPMLPGMAVTGDLASGFAVAGTTTFAFDIPIVFGVAQDIGLSLWAATLPRSNLGLLTTSGSDVSFFSSARLTGIQVFDSGGQAVDGFTITAGSGTRYGPGGVIAVPEPSAALLLSAGLLGLLGLRCLQGLAGRRLRR
ncbi:MAG: PEP-CTERM sorting domain-containing protein [Burkholderiales bacterium]|nr:PEP-CTERM sorting domain-containing protein [Burkholderiales bacterium]